MNGNEVVIRTKEHVLAALAERPEVCRELRLELPGIFNWWMNLSHGLALAGTPCAPSVLQDAIEAVSFAIEGRPDPARSARVRSPRAAYLAGEAERNEPTTTGATLARTPGDARMKRE